MRWPGSALARVRSLGREIVFGAKELDSQLSGKEKQAKAAPGRRTPNRAIIRPALFGGYVLLILECADLAALWPAFGLSGVKSFWGRKSLIRS